MSRAVPRATGAPPRRSPGAKSKPPRVDFDYLDGYSSRAAAELRKTEDALVDFIAAQEKRDSLYTGQRSDLEAKYPAMRKGGAA